MSDPLRTDGPPSIDPAHVPDRDAKIEQLLLAGLDHYFGARYEQAIAVWSRALFLDRNHARARAYIERARNALAERQRESEELLQKGLAAFHTGDGDEARRLLQAAMSMGAPPDEALAVLDRLSRLTPGQVTPSSAEIVRPERAAIQSSVPAGPSRRGMQALLAGGLIAILVAAAVFLAQGNPRSWRALLGPRRRRFPFQLPRRWTTRRSRCPSAERPRSRGPSRSSLLVISMMRWLRSTSCVRPTLRNPTPTVCVPTFNVS
jgi:tetratricopeptide (TPR) repeat protein